MDESEPLSPVVIDARGLRCPLPVLRLETLMRRADPPRLIRIFADDPVAVIDIPHAAKQHGYQAQRLDAPDDSHCVFEVTRIAEDSA